MGEKGGKPRLRGSARDHLARKGGNASSNCVRRQMLEHLLRKRVSAALVNQRERVSRDAAHAAVNQVPGGGLRGRFDTRRHPRELVEADNRSLIQMVTAELSNQVRIRVERGRNSYRHTVNRRVLRAPGE
jgi:hypothetical protein